MKKIVQLFIRGTSILLIGTILYYWNAFFGNPVSKMLATQAAEDYIEEQYPNMEFEEVKANYNFKNGTYDAQLQAKNSVDTHFSLNISQTGQVVNDGYDFYVSSKLNTWYRINDEYSEMVDEVFLAENFPYVPIINYGVLERDDTDDHYFLRESYTLTLENLEIDGVYDVKELAKTSGHIVLETVSPPLTAEHASKMLLEIKEIFDRERIPFYTISLSIQELENLEENPDINRFEVREFFYTDIYEEGLVERVEDAVEELRVHIHELE